MRINNINNQTLKFQGFIKLNKGVEIRGPGFPKAFDAADFFEYTPYKDDSAEDIEQDIIKLKQIESYLETQKLEENKYTIRQIAFIVEQNNTSNYKKDEFNKVANSSEGKKILNLSEISCEDIVDKVKEMKNHVRKALGTFGKDGSVYFKYM